MPNFSKSICVPVETGLEPPLIRCVTRRITCLMCLPVGRYPTSTRFQLPPWISRHSHFPILLHPICVFCAIVCISVFNCCGFPPFSQANQLQPPPVRGLRSVCVDQLPLREAAARFGYSPGSLRNLLAAFRRNPRCSFFLPTGHSASERPPTHGRPARAWRVRAPTVTTCQETVASCLSATVRAARIQGSGR